MTMTNEAMNLSQLAQGAKFLQAYLECSNAIQEGIREILQVVLDPETDPDDRQMAMHSLADALYPNLFEGKLGLDLEHSEWMGAQSSPETREMIKELDKEEASFAQRLQAAMKSRNMTQIQLAEISGVGQPAISNMLNRQCRPQRRTVARFAEALGIAPKDLWPTFDESAS